MEKSVQTTAVEQEKQAQYLSFCRCCVRKNLFKQQRLIRESKFPVAV